MSASYKDIGVSISGHVGQIEIQRPPHNYFDNALINQIADALEDFDRDPECRAVVLCAQGKSFCAGADFANRPTTGAGNESGKHLYKEATRIFRTKKPIVAAVQGAAIGGGLGLALAADFRVTCSEARFSRNSIGLDATRTDLRQRKRRTTDHHVDLSGHQILHRRTAASIGHKLKARAGHALKQKTANVFSAPYASRSS